MSAPRLSWMKRYPLLGPLFGLTFVLLLFEGLIYNHSRTNFLSPDTLGLIITQTTVVATGTLGMTIIIVSGGIDLSAGSVVALTGVIAAEFLKHGYSSWVAVAAAIFIGGLVGLVNGGIIARFKMMPFIVTLGAMGAMRGTAKWIGDNQTVNYNLGRTEGVNALMNNPYSLHAASAPAWWGTPDQAGLSMPAIIPDWLFNLLSHFMGHDLQHPGDLAIPLWLPPIGVLILLALTILMSVVLNRSVFGRHIFALGSNEDTARLCGLRTRTLKILVYSLAGCFVGLAGVFDLARLSQGDVTVGQGLELDVIAAVVIGGASLNGGVGSIWGAIIGALMMTSLRSGTVQMGWKSYYQEIIIGVVLVLAVGVDKIRSRGQK
jgi:ribose transport system permease protein